MARLWHAGCSFFCLLMIVIPLMGCDGGKEPIECTDPLGCVPLTTESPVRIGVLQSLSGKTATLGREQIRGLELALDDRGGKLLGFPVELQIEDTGCTAEGGANAALKIIADPGNIAIFGTTCSGAAATASKAMSEAGLTMVSGNNSAPYLTAIGDRPAPNWQKGYFRTSSNEEASGKAAAIFAYRKLGMRKTASVNDGDIYTKGLTQGFNRAFRDLGGTVVLDTQISKGDETMAPLMTAVIKAGAELLFFPLFQPEANHILNQARENPAFRQIRLMGGGALVDNSFIDAVGNRGIGMYFVGPASYTGERVDRMEKKYTDKYKAPPAVFYFLNAYDAANLLFTGIEAAVIANDAETVFIGRKALRDALYAVRNFPGVTGHLACNKFGDCARPAFNILQMEDPSKGLDGLKKNVRFTFFPSARDTD